MYGLNKRNIFSKCSWSVQIKTSSILPTNSSDSHFLEKSCILGHISNHISSGQITIIPKPELRGFWGDSLTQPPFGVTSAEVVIICPDIIYNIKWIIPSKRYVHSIFLFLNLFFSYMFTCSKKNHCSKKKTPFQPKAPWLSTFEPSKLFRDFRVTRSQWAPPSQGQQDLRRGSRWLTLKSSAIGILR